MATILPFIQGTLAILLILLIIIQKTNTDGSGAFSSEGIHGVTLAKRGAEKVLHRATILVGILFALSILAHLFIG